MKFDKEQRRDSSRVLNGQVRNFDLAEVACRLWEGLNTPLSHRCLDLYRAGDFDTLVRLEVNPANYVSGEDFQLDRCAVDFLRKYPFKGFADRCQIAAEETFLACEQRCAETNVLFQTWESGGVSLRPDVENAILTARYKISQVLGDFVVNEWLENCRFGPGVNIGSRATSDFKKFVEDPSVTEEFEPFALDFVSEFPAWVTCWTHDGELSVVRYSVYPGGKYAVVPKDAKTHRGIETQPKLNGFAQLGIGAMVRKRLKRIGIDLDDQDRNAELARQGSLHGRLATMDLSNASDTIATQLVRALLPADWYHAMNITRTHRIQFNGEVRELSRFCSMGNGFTFELESLIFWALAKATCEITNHSPLVSVYGDDLIFPANAFSAVSTTLSDCGFLVNQRKSFRDGPFRESCGSDWWLGRNVRPYFLKKEVTNVSSLISLANGLSRAARRLSGHLGTDRRFASAVFYCLRRIPPALRGRIATGELSDDSYILWYKRRPGRRVAFSATRLKIERWFPALATALYRGTRVQVATTDVAEYESSTSYEAKGSRQITDYIRDSGEWALQQQPHGTGTDPEVWRGWSSTNTL
jgi:hypothetical protein